MKAYTRFENEVFKSDRSGGLIDRKQSFRSDPLRRGFHAPIPVDKICDFVDSSPRVDELCSSEWCFFGSKAAEKTDQIAASDVRSHPPKND